jgi:hypothetical protein
MTSNRICSPLGRRHRENRERSRTSPLDSLITGSPGTMTAPGQAGPRSSEEQSFPEIKGRSLLARDKDNGMVAAEEFPNSSIERTVLLFATKFSADSLEKLDIYLVGLALLVRKEEWETYSPKHNRTRRHLPA